MSEPLYQWVVYDHPADAPDCFLARRWAIYPNGIVPENWLARGQTLEEVRRLLPPSLFNMGRQAGDDSAIVEVWI